jgi:hypothetical protein
MEGKELAFSDGSNECEGGRKSKCVAKDWAGPALCRPEGGAANAAWDKHRPNSPIPPIANQCCFIRLPMELVDHGVRTKRIR